MKKIFILVGHSDPESENAKFAEMYEKGAKEAGYEVRRTVLGNLKFDPILHKGYKEIQPLEPDLVQAQEDIKWCDHLVLFYPVWWAGMPAILKGFIDRVWLPGFAYRFKKTGIFKGLLWDRLFKGKSARVIVTMDNIPFIARFLFGDITNEIHFGVLRFSGFSVRVTKIGGMKFMSPEQRLVREAKFLEWGRKGK